MPQSRSGKQRLETTKPKRLRSCAMNLGSCCLHKGCFEAGTGSVSQSQLERDRLETSCISSMHAQTLGNLCNCLAIKNDQLLAIGCSAVNMQPLMLSSRKRVTVLLTANAIFTPCLKIILLFVHQNSTFKDARSNEHTSGRFCNSGLGSFLLWLSLISASCLFRRYFVSAAFHF